MAKILCLAPSGFGKSTGTGEVPELGFKGLPKESSYIISKTTKPLPYAGQGKQWPIAPINQMSQGRRVICATPQDALVAMSTLAKVPSIKNVVLDDFNYYMQDWYMANAARTGWDAPKQIGMDMGKLFAAFEQFEGADRNLVVLAHGEDVTKPGGRIYTKLKTTGKMVDEYVTPEGKFDIVLVGKSEYDTQLKKAVKSYVTNEDEYYTSPKSPVGMFKELYISNDLGPIIDRVNQYYNG